MGQTHGAFGVRDLRSWQAARSVPGAQGCAFAAYQTPFPISFARHVFRENDCPLNSWSAFRSRPVPSRPRQGGRLREADQGPAFWWGSALSREAPGWTASLSS
jgi:hypothetical protein